MRPQFLNHRFWLFLSIPFLCFCTSQENRVQVGSYTITQKDINFRTKLLRMDHPDATPQRALTELVRAYTYAEILKRQNNVLDENQLAIEEKRIERKTTRLEKLSKIRSLFSGEKLSYYRTFVLPLFAHRRVFEIAKLRNKDWLTLEMKKIKVTKLTQ